MTVAVNEVVIVDGLRVGYIDKVEISVKKKYRFHFDILGIQMHWDVFTGKYLTQQQMIYIIDYIKDFIKRSLE